MHSVSYNYVNLRGKRDEHFPKITSSAGSRAHRIRKNSLWPDNDHCGVSDVFSRQSRRLALFHLTDGIEKGSTLECPLCSSEC